LNREIGCEGVEWGKWLRVWSNHRTFVKRFSRSGHFLDHCWVFQERLDCSKLWCIVLFIHQSLYSALLGPGHFFSFVILYAVGRTAWTGDQTVARPLPIHRTTQTE
jgi:hypothetical protein